MKMRAAVYSGNENIGFKEVQVPVIGDDEALVRVHAAAICGTDIKILRSGYRKMKPGEERILGHEIAGEIWETGKLVRGFERGMRVSIAPNIGCGHCKYCRVGHTELCADFVAFGIHIDGGFAEYMKVPAKALHMGNLISFSEETPYHEAVLAEPLACCYNALKSVYTSTGDAVLIVGAGPMGALHMQMQKLAGASPLMVADIAQKRLDLVRPLGADVLINSAERDLKSTVMEHTGDEGADVIITAVPVPEIQQLALEVAAKLGRVNFFGGLPQGKDRVEISTNLLHYNGIVATGTTGAALADYQHALRLIVQGKIDTDTMISKRFKVEDVKDAFQFAMSGEGLKTLIEF
jgi:threonine dehydrogenase-like Zn-dependent dehydrogenase